MNKRIRFVSLSLVLTVVTAIGGLLTGDFRIIAVLVTSLAAYILTCWVLFDDLKGVEWFVLGILPVLYTLGVNTFLFFVPEVFPSILGARFDINTARFIGLIVKTVLLTIYAIGFYAILLTVNIFSVSSIRTIQLARAARSVGFIMSLISAIFLFNVIFSLRLVFYANILVVLPIVFLLSFLCLWSINFRMANLKEEARLAGLISVLVAQVTGVISFWPTKPLVSAFILLSAFYCLLGVFERRLSNKYFVGYYPEYMVFFVLVIVGVFLTASWRNY